MNAPVISAVDRFTALKKRKDTLSQQLAVFNGRLEASRDRYNDIMRELATYGIGSLGELQAKIEELRLQIDHHLTASEEQLVKMEGELRAVDVV